MNFSLTILEIAVAVLALAILLADLWTEPGQRRFLGFGAVGGLVLVLAASFFLETGDAQYAFSQSYVLDGLAMFFKRFFLVAAILVLLMSFDFADRLGSGLGEFYALVLCALVGMMFAASANDFTVLFVSVELITVTFYVLTSFQRWRLASLEAGVKYLLLGALASAILVYGIALVFGITGTTSFDELNAKAMEFRTQPVFVLGLLLVLAGLAFKIAVFPLQIWTPDVYQGAPAPVTAFLAVGSKAAGFVLLLRLLFVALPHELVVSGARLIMVLSAVTILYGSLCAIPQRSLKRLMGYSSIANAGFLLLGIAALSQSGLTAVLYFLAGYLFTVLGAFAVICVVIRQMDSDDISSVAGLHQRSPLLAATLAVAMVSLAGVPPLAGFFGKFLLLRAVLEAGPAYYWLVAVAVAGVGISIWYYFGIIRSMYWPQNSYDPTPIGVSWLTKTLLGVCLAGIFFLGIYPAPAVRIAGEAIKILK